MNLSSPPNQGGLAKSRMVGVEKSTVAQKSISTYVIFICILGAIFYCYEYYLRVAPSVMVEELKNTFLLSNAGFGFLAACYNYAYTPMQVPVGMMMDKFGLRKILTFACFCCVFGTFLFANTTTLWMAQLGRFLVGFGSAFAYVGILKISNVWLPPRYFALMAGLSTTLGMIGGMTGIISMSYLVQAVGWQATLYYSIYAGIPLTILLWLVLRDNVSDKNNENVQFSQKSEVKVWQGLLEISKSRSMWINGIIGCLTYLPLSAFGELWAVPFLEKLGFSKTDAAMGSSMVILGFAVGAPLFGILSDFFASRRKVLAIGSFISALFMFLVVGFPSTSKIWMFSILFCSGFFASAEILVFAVGNDLNKKSIAATAAAFTNMVVMLGGMIAPYLIGKCLDISNSEAGLENYSNALMILPISLALAGFLSLSLKETYNLRH